MGILMAQSSIKMSTYEGEPCIEIRGEWDQPSLDALIKAAPFCIRGVKTDNGAIFTNRYNGYYRSIRPFPRMHAFTRSCRRYSITHYLIDPGKPAQNGKIERFHRTAEDDFWQQETFTDLNSVKRKFRDFLHYHNNERENQANDYLTPLEKLQTFPKYEKVKEYIAEYPAW